MSSAIRATTRQRVRVSGTGREGGGEVTEEKEEAADVEDEEFILVVALVVDGEKGEGAGA